MGFTVRFSAFESRSRYLCLKKKIICFFLVCSHFILLSTIWLIISRRVLKYAYFNNKKYNKEAVRLVTCKLREFCVVYYYILYNIVLGLTQNNAKLLFSGMIGFVFIIYILFVDIKTFLRV